MATVASLDVNLGVRSREFTREINRARRTVQGFGTSVNQTFKRIGAVTLVAVAGLARLSNQALRTSDEIAKSARNAGLSSDAFQRLAESFRLGGSTSRALVRGNQALLRNIRDLGRGLSTQADAFSALGLSYRDIRDLAPEEQFLLTRQRLSELTNATEQSAIAQQLFGRAGKEFGTILTANNAVIEEQGNRLQRLGGIIDEDLLGSTELLVDQLETTSAVIQAQFTNALLEAAQTAGDFTDLDSVITDIGLGVRNLATGIFDLIKFIVEWQTAIANVLGVWIALRAVMFASAAITAISTLSGAIGTLVLSIRTYNFALLTARLATIGFYAALIAIPIVVGAIGVAIYSARDALGMAFNAAITLVRANFDIFILKASNGLLSIRGFMIRIGAAISTFIVDRLNNVIDLVNNVQRFLGRDEIELISSDAAANAMVQLKDIEGQIMANVAAQEVLRDTANAAAAAVASSASAAVSAGIQGISDVVSGAASLLFGATEPTAPDSPSASPGVDATEMAETDTTTFWERISAAYNLGAMTGAAELSASLATNLSTAFSQGDFDSLGDIFLSTIQQNLQMNVQEGLNEIFASFFDGFLDSISQALSGAGGGGGGLGGLLSAGLGLFGFADGGVVPGSTGEPVPAIVHAGEVVLNREQQQNLLSNGVPGSNTQSQTINVTGDVTAATRRAVREMGTEIASMTQSTFQERGILNG